LDSIEKWGVVDRVTHVFLVVGVSLNILTGLPLFDKEVFGFLLPLWQIEFPFGLRLHILAAALLVVALALHLSYRLLIHKPSEIRLTMSDIKDFLLITKHWFGLSKDYPRLGCHHPGQKMVYWGAAVLGLVVVGTSGIILAGETSPLTTGALLLHDLAFILITAIVAGHFVLAITPSNWPVLRAMFTDGMVPLGWAMHHHPLWAEKVARLEKAPSARPAQPASA
jgi:cytochrome b subunit of formate dehydrogenase